MVNGLPMRSASAESKSYSRINAAEGQEPRSFKSIGDQWWKDIEDRKEERRIEGKEVERRRKQGDT